MYLIINIFFIYNRHSLYIFIYVLLMIFALTTIYVLYKSHSFSPPNLFGNGSHIVAPVFLAHHVKHLRILGWFDVDFTIRCFDVVSTLNRPSIRLWFYDSLFRRRFNVESTIDATLILRFVVSTSFQRWIDVESTIDSTLIERRNFTSSQLSLSTIFQRWFDIAGRRRFNVVSTSMCPLGRLCPPGSAVVALDN